MINKCMSIYIKSEGNNVPHYSLPREIMFAFYLTGVTNVPHYCTQIPGNAT